MTNKIIENSVLIEARPSTVWRYLTNADLMKGWMGEPEMAIEVVTGWKVGGPISIRGYHHVAFENKGVVKEFEPEKIVAYTHLSSLSRLANAPKNYALIAFRLSASGKQTLLRLTVENFPTETIYQHLALYWRATIVLLKDRIETV